MLTHLSAALAYIGVTAERRNRKTQFLCFFATKKHPSEVLRYANTGQKRSFKVTINGSAADPDERPTVVSVLTHTNHFIGGVFMSRKKKNVKMELNNRLNELLQIGQKKIKEKTGGEHFNPNRAPGIHSVKTADTYRRIINQFGDYCKMTDVKDVRDIDRNVVRGFMATRSKESSWTASKDLSALNKVLETHYTPKEFGYGRRTQDAVVHNRGILTANSTRDLPQNADVLHFARATGCRRQSILLATPAQAIWDGAVGSTGGTVIGFTLREKGGRVRNALVLPSERAWVTDLVNSRFNERGKYGNLIDHCDSHCNPHFDRGTYAQEMYAAMVAARDSGADIYMGHRDTFINQDALDKAIRTSPYKGETAHGYDKHICAELSQQLGHNRIDVVVRSYLCKS